MKKLEKLSSSNFNKFKDAEIENLHMVIGGRLYVMSTRSESHPVHAHDVADLTAGGSSYNGVPGDGTADDWGEASWYPGNVDLGKVLEHDHPGETTISLGSGLDYEAYDPFTGVVGSYTT